MKSLEKGVFSALTQLMARKSLVSVVVTHDSTKELSIHYPSSVPSVVF